MKHKLQVQKFAELKAEIERGMADVTEGRLTESTPLWRSSAHLLVDQSRESRQVPSRSDSLGWQNKTEADGPRSSQIWAAG
jgi:hypothetical protein